MSVYGTQLTHPAVQRKDRFRFDQRWAGLAAGKPQVRVTGPCKSACTVLLKHLPRGNICVTPEASLGFHQALRHEMTNLLWSGYPADIRA